MWKANGSPIGVYFFSIHWETKEETNPFSERKFPLNTRRMVSQGLATLAKAAAISQTKSEFCITNTKPFLQAFKAKDRKLAEYFFLIVM